MHDQRALARLAVGLLQESDDALYHNVKYKTEERVGIKWWVTQLAAVGAGWLNHVLTRVAAHAPLQMTPTALTAIYHKIQFNAKVGASGSGRQARHLA